VSGPCQGPFSACFGPSSGTNLADKGPDPGQAPLPARDLLRTLRCASRANTTPCACVRSVQARRRPGARGLAGWPPLHASTCRSGAAGRPKFLGSPRVPLPCSSTPAGPNAPAITVRRRGPRYENDEGYPRVVISGLHSTALALAVYASWCGSRHRCTQDSLPAAGQALPGGIGYPQDSYEEF
jgi:hypothetical protein